METLDKSHKFNGSTLNRNLDELDAWFLNIAATPVLTKPVVKNFDKSIGILHDSVYISEGSSRNFNEPQKQSRSNGGALEAILFAPPQKNSRTGKVGRPPSTQRSQKTSRKEKSPRTETGMGRRIGSNESLSASTEGNQNSPRQEKLAEDEKNITRPVRSNESLSPKPQSSPESSKKDKPTEDKALEMGRSGSSEALRSRRSSSRSGEERPGANLRRVRSNESLSPKPPSGRESSNKDKSPGMPRSGSSEALRSRRSGSGEERPGANLRRVRSSESLSPKPQSSRERTNKDKPLGMPRSGSSENLRTRRSSSGTSEERPGANLRRVRSNESLPTSTSTDRVARRSRRKGSMAEGLPRSRSTEALREGYRSRARSTERSRDSSRDAPTGQEASMIPRVRSVEGLSTSDSGAPKSASGAVRRIRSSGSLSKSDEGSPRSVVRDGTTERSRGVRRSRSNTETLLKTLRTAIKDDLSVSQHSQGSRRQYARTSSCRVLKSRSLSSSIDLQSNKTDVPMGRKKRDELAQSEHGTKACRLPSSDSSAQSRPRIRTSVTEGDGDDRYPRSGSRRVGRRRSNAKETTRSPKRISDTNGRRGDRPLKRTLSAGDLYAPQRRDSSEDLQVDKPKSSLCL